MVRRKRRRLKEKPKKGKDGIFRQSKSKKEANEFKTNQIRKHGYTRRFPAAEYESKNERVVRKAVEKSIVSEFLPKHIQANLSKIDGFIDEAIKRKIGDEFGKQVIIKREKIMLKDFVISEFIHGKYKGWRIVYKTTENPMYHKGEHFFIMEKTKIKDE